MKFEVKTDEQIQADALLPDGTYDFEVFSAVEKTSSKGNAMIELSLHVFDEGGTIRPVRDWIMPSFAKKFKHCLSACGLLSLYEKGEVSADDLLGKKGKVKIVRKPYTNKDGLEMLSNAVDDYVRNDSKVADALGDDEIPF